jgi:Holliday junction resolvasome RuvABC endonuclease subunit
MRRDTMPRHVYLGADVQTTGVAFAAIDAASGAVVMHAWRDMHKGDAHNTLEAQAVEIVRAVRRELDDCDMQPVSLAVERVGGGRGVQSMLRVADIAGVVAGLVQQAWPDRPLWRPTPAEWKQACGMPGNAAKDAIRNHLAEAVVWPSDPWLGHDEFRRLRQDVVDAIGIAWGDRAASLAAVTADREGAHP